MKQKRKTRDRLMTVLFLALSIVVLFPAVYVLCNSFLSPQEAVRRYGALATGGTLDLSLLPDTFSLQGYVQVLLRRTVYWLRFWRTLMMCGAIVAGQLLVSVLGGFAFAKFSFPGKRVLFYLLVVLMLMPVQVTLVPNYIVLERLHLLDTYGALILPAMFLPFGTFLMTQIFKAVPDEVLQAGQIDGAGTLTLLFRVLLPAGRAGTISLCLLTFIDAWNMVEQPLAFLQDSEMYPFSVFLASTSRDALAVVFPCGVLAMLPVLLLFWFFNEELVEGIEFTGIK